MEPCCWSVAAPSMASIVRFVSEAISFNSFKTVNRDTKTVLHICSVKEIPKQCFILKTEIGKTLREKYSYIRWNMPLYFSTIARPSVWWLGGGGLATHNSLAALSNIYQISRNISIHSSTWRLYHRNGQNWQCLSETMRQMPTMDVFKSQCILAPPPQLAPLLSIG
jgi:hypothetical protein